LHSFALGPSGFRTFAIIFAVIEGSAGQIGGQRPKAEIAFSFLESLILFQILGWIADILTSNG